MTGEQSMVKLTLTIWTYILEMWKLCNSHLHENADQLNLPRNYQQAATTLYEPHHQLPPEAQEALYQQPVDVLLE